MTYDTSASEQKEETKTEVKTLKVKGQSALVEWSDKEGLHRAYIPYGKIDGTKVVTTVLKAGIPYGAPWEEVKPEWPSSEQIADKLRNSGIWTAEDLRANSAVVNSVLAGITAHLWPQLHVAAKQEKQSPK